MKASNREKIACAYFFIAPALAYGLFTSRLPALKELVPLTDADVGSLLLALGVSTLTGLVLSSFVIDRGGSRNIGGASIILLCAGITGACFVGDYWQIFICLVLTGLGVGFCDVAINALGIELERRFNVLALSMLHAVSSLGGVTGSLAGSFFAGLDISPFYSCLIVIGAYFLFWPFAFRQLQNATFAERKVRISWRTLPSLIFILAAIGLICHVVEGSAGEWGSILLSSVKGASQEEAALVFAAFTGPMVICRLCVDRLRKSVDDFKVMIAGVICGALGMATVLVFDSPLICLSGYAIMGVGLGPVVPIAFSRAGAMPGISSGQASAVISIFSYAGLLLFPPLIGYLAKYAGLETALWSIFGCCILMIPPCFCLRKRSA